MKIGEAPLLGLSQDFHPLDNAHAEHTTMNAAQITLFVQHFRFYKHKEF